MDEPETIKENAIYILGVDIARQGKDETAFVVLEKEENNDKIYLKYLETTQNTKLTETIGKIQYLHSFFNFRKIYIDTTGLGSGVGDVLSEKISPGIIEEIVFTKKSKPEMFTNLKLLMQQKKLKLPNHITNKKYVVKKMYMQFFEIHTKFTGDSDVPKIFHTERAHDDIICALALACMYFGKRKVKRSYKLGGF